MTQLKDAAALTAQVLSLIGEIELTDEPGRSARLKQLRDWHWAELTDIRRRHADKAHNAAPWPAKDQRP